MPFNEDYLQTMETIREIGGTAAEEYASAQETTRDNGSGKNNVDWGGLVNGFAAAAQSWADSRRENGGRQWNDFKVEVDEGTQKTVLAVAVILAAAIVFFGIKQARKK